MDDDGAIPKSEQAWLAELMTRDCGPMQSDLRMACRMLAHNRPGPIREERSLKEALAEYEGIECEDVPTMRIDPRTRGSNKIRGESLRVHSLYAISHCSAAFLPSPPRGGPRVGARTFGSTIQTLTM
jgi:hypothetical protein